MTASPVSGVVRWGPGVLVIAYGWLVETEAAHPLSCVGLAQAGALLADGDHMPAIGGKRGTRDRMVVPKPMDELP